MSFMLFGLGALLVGMSWLIFEPAALAAFHYAPHTVALTHLFILGFILSIVMGSTYQLVPVALETKLAHPQLGLHHFWIHTTGVVGMVISFYSWRMGGVTAYGGLVYSGMLLFLFNIITTLRRAPRLDVIGGFILSSVLWMLFTMSAGLLVAIHKQWPFLPWEPLATLQAHAHLGLIGIFVMIIVGVSLKLVPMFALSEIQSLPRARWILALLNLGLPLLVYSLLTLSNGLLVLAALTLSTGIVVFGVEIYAIVRARKRRQIDWGLKMFFTAQGLLFAALVCGLLLVYPGLASVGWVGQFKTVYALLSLFGFVALAIIGMLHKILPFLVWFRTYSPHIGKAKLPATGEMYSPALAVISFGLFMGGLVAGCVGAFSASNLLAMSAGVLFTSGCMVFLANMGLVVRHWFFPQIEPLKR